MGKGRAILYGGGVAALLTAGLLAGNHANHENAAQHKAAVELSGRLAAHGTVVNVGGLAVGGACAHVSLPFFDLSGDASRALAPGLDGDAAAPHEQDIYANHTGFSALVSHQHVGSAGVRLALAGSPEHNPHGAVSATVCHTAGSSETPSFTVNFGPASGVEADSLIFAQNPAAPASPASSGAHPAGGGH